MGEQKFLTEAQKTELRAGIRAGVQNALAINPQAGHVPSASKNEPVASDVVGKNGNGKGQEKSPEEVARLEKAGADFLVKIGNDMDSAKDIGQLMRLTEVVTSKKEAKQRISLKLPSDLAHLLIMNRNFSKEFNAARDRFGGYLSKFLFAEGAGSAVAFPVTVLSALRAQNKVADKKRIFFSEYLKLQGLSPLLTDIPAVKNGLHGEWEKYEVSHGMDMMSDEIFFKILVKELSHRRNGDFEKDGKVILKITSTSEDEIRIEYIDGNNQWVNGKIIPKFARKFADSLNEKFGFTLEKKKSQKGARRDASASDVPVVKGVSVAGEGVSRPTEGRLSPDARYESFFEKLGDTAFGARLEKERLESVVAAGLQPIADAFPLNEAAAVEFIQEHHDALVIALAESVSIRLKRFTLKPEDEEWFARNFVEKAIQDFIKK